MSVLQNFKTPIRVLAAFLLFVLLIYILITQTSLPEKLINKYFQAMLGKDLGLKLSIGDLGGSVISDLTFDDVFVQYEIGNTIYQLAFIDYMKVEYSLTDIWRKEWVIRKLLIDTLEASLHDEAVRQIAESTGGESGEDKGGISFNIRQVELRHGSLRELQSDKDYYVQNLDLYLGLARRNDSLVVDIDTARAIFPRFGMELDSLKGKYSYTDNRLFADSAFISALNSRLFFDASLKDFDSLKFDMLVHRSSLDLTRIGAVFDVDLEGSLNVDGDLHGHTQKVSANLMLNGDLFGKGFKDMRTQMVYHDSKLYLDRIRGGAINSSFEGSGMLDFGNSPNLYSFTGRMEKFNLNSLVENSFETSFSGNLILDGRSFSSDDMSLQVRMNLQEGYFDTYQFDSASGAIQIFYDSLFFSKPLHVYYDNADLAARGKIEYSGQIDISGQGEIPDIRFLSKMVSLPQIEGRGKGSFSFTGPVDDPALNADFSSDSVTALGFKSDSLALKLRLSRFASALEGSLEITGGSYHFDRFEGDSLYTDVVFDSNRIIFDTLNLFSQRVNLQSRMTMEFSDSLTQITAPVLKLTVDTFTISAENPIRFSMADTTWSIDNFELRSENGSLSAQGNYYGPDSLAFSLTCDTINLTPVFDFYLPRQGLAGIGRFEASLKGSISAPRFDLKGAIDSVRFQEQYYGLMDFDIDYSDSTLHITRLTLVSGENSSSFSGTIPINLAFEEVEERIIVDRDINIDVDATSTPLFLLPVVLPDVEWVEGENKLDMMLTGQPNNPEFSGSFRLRDGRVKFFYLQNVLEKVDADVTFSGRQLILDSIITRAKTGGRAGYARLTGTISLEHLMKPELDIELDAGNFPFKYDLGDISGEIDEAYLTIEGQDTISVRGDVKLLSFRYAEPLQPAIEAEAIAAADTANKLNYHINLTAPSNLKVVNNDFDLELGGELRIFREGGSMNFLGTMETIRGKYFLFNQSFTVLPGGEIRFNDIDEFNPEFHIRVETRMTAQGERLRAQFLLTGTLREPQLTATENSEVGDNQFFEYMSFMSTVSGGDTTSSPFTDRLRLGASEMALNKVSQYFARKIGVETLEINPYYDGSELDLESSELRIGFYTTPNLYVYGSTQLDFRGAGEVGFEYRFSRHFFLSGQRDDQDLYHLNMNLNWEF